MKRVLVVGCDESCPSCLCMLFYFSFDWLVWIRIGNNGVSLELAWFFYIVFPTDEPLSKLRRTGYN